MEGKFIISRTLAPQVIRNISGSKCNNCITASHILTARGAGYSGREGKPLSISSSSSLGSSRASHSTLPSISIPVEVVRWGGGEEGSWGGSGVG